MWQARGHRRVVGGKKRKVEIRGMGEFWLGWWMCWYRDDGCSGRGDIKVDGVRDTRHNILIKAQQFRMKGRGYQQALVKFSIMSCDYIEPIPQL